VAIVYLGLGSNVGDRKKNLQTAIKKLSALRDVKITKISSVYETEPVGLKDQPWFYNAVAEIETTLAPRRILQMNKDIEKIMQRERTVRWGPRKIDIDILLYDDIKIDDPDFKVPHPEMFKRGFVLIPLYEIAPDLKFNSSRLEDFLRNSGKESVQKLNEKI
jgi:2-amino-4-hydroxy-6-hydroxymethyldihydropteridine diphosphokinase